MPFKKILKIFFEKQKSFYQKGDPFCLCELGYYFWQ